VESTTAASRFGEVLRRGIVENQWIESVIIDAIDEHGRIHSQIIMRIDWDRHQLHIEDGRSRVVLDESLPVGERVSSMLGFISARFSSAAKSEGWTTSWLVVYKRDVDREYVKAQLGLVDCRRQWGDGEVRHVLGDNPEKLDELFIDWSMLVAKDDPHLPASNRRRGVVKRWVVERGFGFIIPNERSYLPDGYWGDIFVHFTNIVSGAQELVEGQIVEFEPIETPRGIQALNVRVCS
jgi:CspA family cold shock protein